MYNGPSSPQSPQVDPNEVPYLIKRYVGLIFRMKFCVILFWLFITIWSSFYGWRLLAAVSNEIIPPPGSQSVIDQAIFDAHFPKLKKQTNLVLYLEGKQGEIIACPAPSKVEDRSLFEIGVLDDFPTMNPADTTSAAIDVTTTPATTSTTSQQDTSTTAVTSTPSSDPTTITMATTKALTTTIVPVPSPCDAAHSLDSYIQGLCNGTYVKEKYGNDFVYEYQSYYSMMDLGFLPEQFNLTASPNGKVLTLIIVLNMELSDPIGNVFANWLTNKVADYIDPRLQVTLTGAPAFVDVIIGGVERDFALMDGIVLPLALVVLGLILKSFRLLIIPVLCVGVAALTSITLVYFVAISTPVISFTPSLMMSLMIAMSIDYSLFLLSRYREELLKGANTRDAIEGMLTHAGHVVMVSGLTLTVAFAGLIVFPIQMLSSCGLGCTISLLVALSINFTLTPAVLMQFDSFFEKSVRSKATVNTNSSGEYLPLLSTLVQEPESSLSEAERSLGLVEGYEKSMWFRLAQQLVKPWVGILVILLTCAFVVPFGLHIFNLPTSGAIGNVLPRGAAATRAYDGIFSNFGAGTLFPYRFIIVNETSNEFAILPPVPGEDRKANYAQFTATTNKVKKILNNLSLIDNTHIEDFQTIYTQDASAVALYYLCLKGISKDPVICPISRGTAQDFVSPDGKAIIILFLPKKFDPFGIAGDAWLKSMRAAIVQESARTGYSIGLTGSAAETTDAKEETYSLFVPMIIATSAVVFLMLTAAFKSLFISLRSVLTIGLTLVWIYGFASMVYADKDLNVLNFGGLTGKGEFYWLSPIFSFTIIVGLGVDYDVFLLGRIVEARDAGFSAKDSILIGAYSTGHIITAAGCIMAIAFSGLLFSSVPALNQLSFFMVFSVLFDTFVVRTLMAPSIMGLLGELNYWPRNTPAVNKRLGGGTRMEKEREFLREIERSKKIAFDSSNIVVNNVDAP